MTPLILQTMSNVYWLIMIVNSIENGLVVIPTGSIIIKGSRPFSWILLKEANMYHLVPEYSINDTFHLPFRLNVGGYTILKDVFKGSTNITVLVACATLAFNGLLKRLIQLADSRNEKKRF